LEKRKLEARDRAKKSRRTVISPIHQQLFFGASSFLALVCLHFTFKMRLLALSTAVLSFAYTAACAEKGNLTKPLTSRQILPSHFKPPQNFQNVNLVHIISLEKSYPKEVINVVIENIASTPQDEYYIPFTSQQMETIGSLEVKDKKDLGSGLFDVAAVEFDAER